MFLWQRKNVTSDQTPVWVTEKEEREQWGGKVLSDSVSHECWLRLRGTLISRWQVPIHKINFQFLTMLFVVNSRCESWVIHVNCYWIVTYEQYNYPIWGFMCGFSGYQALTYNELQTRVCSLNRSEFNQDFSHEDEKNIYQQLYL